MKIRFLESLIGFCMRVVPPFVMYELISSKPVSNLSLQQTRAFYEYKGICSVTEGQCSSIYEYTVLPLSIY